jgi:hypothetical protein
MTGVSFEKKLKEYQEGIKSWCKFVENFREEFKLKGGTQFNKEENTMVKFVVPLLEILGWEPFSLVAEVEFEYNVKGAGLADIALYIDQKPRILIEVKSIFDDFKEQWPTKIFKYISSANVQFGIATNGKELILYDNYRVKKTSREGCKLLYLNLEKQKTDEYSAVLSLLSKKSVENGRLERFAEEFHKEGGGFFQWREPRKKKGDKIYNERVLRLKFAQEILPSL